MIIDTHAHLADPKFAGDLEDVLRRAGEAGVGRVIAVGDAIDSSAACLEMARRHPSLLFATAGVHPHNAKTFGAEAERQIRQMAQGSLAQGSLAQEPKCVAIGEIGLDYHYRFSTPEAQRAAFAAQLALARELRLPAVIHCREAFDDLFSILRENPLGEAGGVVHCFTGSPEQARAILDLGLCLGAGGIVTFPKAASLREAIRQAPLESLLLETDSPYLAPVPHRGERNEPAFTRDVAAFLARDRRIPLEILAAATTANAARLFHLSIS